MSRKGSPAGETRQILAESSSSGTPGGGAGSTVSHLLPLISAPDATHQAHEHLAESIRSSLTLPRNEARPNLFLAHSPFEPSCHLLSPSCKLLEVEEHRPGVCR